MPSTAPLLITLTVLGVAAFAIVCAAIENHMKRRRSSCQCRNQCNTEGINHG